MPAQFLYQMLISLPKVVYMVVDKKIELEIKLLKDFPEWDFCLIMI